MFVFLFLPRVPHHYLSPLWSGSRVPEASVAGGASGGRGSTREIIKEKKVRKKACNSDRLFSMVLKAEILIGMRWADEIVMGIFDTAAA